MNTMWFYALEDQREGPIAEEELREMLFSGRIPVDTLVWSEGMAAWASAEKVADLYRPAPPPPPVTETVAPQVEPSTATAGSRPTGAPTRAVPLPHAAPERVARTRQAWNRFLARMIDIFLFTTVLGMFFGIEAEEGTSFFTLALISAVGLGISAFFEAFCISRWGMTPGKWIFRIRVVHQENRMLDYSEALRRAFQVLTQGMFFGIWPMALVFEALAFKELVDQGQTPWDRRLECAVQHAPMRGIHLAAAVVVSFCLFMVFLAAYGNQAVSV